MSTETATLERRFIRQYSPEERTNALALYDTIGNLEQTSETLGIPKSTIHGWLSDPNNLSTARTEKAKDLAQKFENAANLFLDLAVKKSKKAGFNHLITGAGIAVDKSQILRNQPTSITMTVERTELTILLQSALGVAVAVSDNNPQSD